VWVAVGVVVVGEVDAVKAVEEFVRGNPVASVRGPTLSYYASHLHGPAKVSLQTHYSSFSAIIKTLADHPPVYKVHATQDQILDPTL